MNAVSSLQRCWGLRCWKFNLRAPIINWWLEVLMRRHWRRIWYLNSRRGGLSHIWCRQNAYLWSINGLWFKQSVGGRGRSPRGKLVLNGMSGTVAVTVPDMPSAEGRLHLFICPSSSLLILQMFLKTSTALCKSLICELRSRIPAQPSTVKCSDAFVFPASLIAASAWTD